MASAEIRYQDDLKGLTPRHIREMQDIAAAGYESYRRDRPLPTQPGEQPDADLSPASASGGSSARPR